MLKESLERIDAQNLALNNLKNQVRSKEDECNKLENEFKEYAGDIEEQLNRVFVVKKQEKKKLKELKNEASKLSQECDSIFKQKEDAE